MQLSFNANGQDFTIEVKPNMPLVWVLKDVLGKQSVAIGCGRNTSCGGCTVRIDGERRNSCSVPAEAVQGCTIVTPGWRPPEEAAPEA